MLQKIAVLQWVSNSLGDGSHILFESAILQQLPVFMRWDYQKKTAGKLKAALLL